MCLRIGEKLPGRVEMYRTLFLRTKQEIIEISMKQETNEN